MGVLAEPKMQLFNLYKLPPITWTLSWICHMTGWDISLSSFPALQMQIQLAVEILLLNFIS